MKALKQFLKSFHFLTIGLFICLSFFILSTDIFTETSDNTIGTALASIEGNHHKYFSLPTETTAISDILDLNHKEIRGTLREDDSLSKSFNRNKVPDEIRKLIIDQLKGQVDFNSLLPGDNYSIIIDQEGKLVECVYETGPFDIYSIRRIDGYNYDTTKINIPLESRTVQIDGTVTSTLFAAFQNNHEDQKLIYAFADIFASRIDFNTETRTGDRFSLAVEKFYKFDEFVGYGKILVARYEQPGNQILEGFLHSSGKRRAAYFDRAGKEMGTSFIKSPLPMGRVTSSFTSHRKHPILGIIRKHLGVDLAAPKGTPIMAVADGKINFIGSNGGFGKQIVLAHGGDYKTHYGHLSSFKKGLHKDGKVKQKEIIGYVGSTGLATGPHLDYRIEHHGVFKNPFNIEFEPKSILVGQELEELNTTVNKLAGLLDSPQKEKILHVRRSVSYSHLNLL
ncbi:MAG: M23 family metallopeptidase [Proteobacteria bacterium]|nr:M23 family metallopeptidase [Pseudomonadota bacterium]MBU1714057.1 M23 family metallopeptidase [Pseudomonadota bacterium]